MFDNMTVQVNDPHYFTTDHRAYNKATAQAFNTYCEANQIDPAKMTPRQAWNLVNRYQRIRIRQ
jgi:LmbE family N-acetylglucosaminyl deacetylase